jgi:hypothetical protein
MKMEELSASVQRRIAIQKPQSPQHAMYALGRLKTGAMNKTEAAYALHLESLKQAGEVVFYKFEGLTFRLADNTRFTPDFVVMLPDGMIELHEVKGARAIFRDDAKVKIKVASALYPFLFKAVFPIAKKHGGGWEIEEF